MGTVATTYGLADLVELARYPIDRLETPEGVAFLDDQRAAFGREGVMVLADFLTTQGLALLAAEANTAAPLSYRQVKNHNVYLVKDDLSFPEDHPRRRRLTTQTSTVADDHLPSPGGLRTLYDAPELRAFLAPVLGKPVLFPYVDPLASLNLGVTEHGEQLNWHFDFAEFATTLLLQSGEEGGAFEYVPNIRGDGDPAAEARVAAILDGDRSGVKVLAMPPGALVLFQGHHSIHRVAPVSGTRPRLCAILSYSDQPGAKLDEYTRRTFYGRAA